MSDLISRGALRNFITTAIERQKGRDIDLINVAELLEVIDRQHSIEAVPVVHGEWIETDNDIDVWYECSECEKDAMQPYNFCPHCGAKMKGGVE